MLTKAEIGSKIRRLRQEKNISQAELGKALGKSHAAISDVERGVTDVTVSDLSIIARILSVSISEFLEGQGEKPTISFAQNRYAKDITPAEKKEADQSIKNFDDFVINEFKNK